MRWSAVNVSPESHVTYPEKIAVEFADGSCVVAWLEPEFQVSDPPMPATLSMSRETRPVVLSRST